MTAEATNTTVPGYQLLPSQMTLKVIVNEWIFNKDYPILKVVRKYDKSTISFVQFLDNHESSNFRRPAFRHMPVSYTTGDEKEFSSTAPRLWLRNAKQTIMYNPIGLTNKTWFLVNPQQTDLYRVNYDDENWRMLKRSMENGELPSTIRAQLLDDALFLGRRGFLNYEFALNLTQSLAVTGEKEYIVWNTVLRHFEYAGNIVNSIDDNKLDKYRNLFKNYIKNLITPVFKKINDYNMNMKKTSSSSLSDHSDLLLQTDIYKWACKVGIDQCIMKVRMEFNEWKRKADPDQDNPIKPDARYATLCNAMYNGDAGDFEFLYYRYMNTSLTDPNKHIYLKSLYCYKQISRTISSILSDTLLNEYSLPHLYEISNIWQALAESPVITTAPFDYLLAHWKSILKKFSEYTPILRNILEGATINISREDHLNAIYRLREDAVGSLENLKEIFAEVITHVKYKINWKYQELNTFLSWLTKVTPVTPAPIKV